ncbi:variant erythrocyte surface antigen-1 family protein [Babesia divergens]|uniref:Variant erythrocyte surface antigen-1 family protein n=1 Tax=Babesia divergens TaxID=32595 RepID=A0AAD9GBF1_BABDI|nr:variant erythrocyte surface antigen-1 family protein [Babesia divergens]
MVCCMYYTDVFVGADNIVKLKNALEAELKGSVKPVELTQLDPLASGLGFLAGLPACLCKTKESVEKGLGKIYEELNKNISLINCSNSKLNCPSCKLKDVPCKCCVIQSIKDVKGCQCLKTGGNKTSCHCNGQKVSCTQVLAGLEACLHLQCLQSDMNEICKCNDPEKCCQDGQCNGNSGVTCDFCEKLQTKTPVATTGLGLSPPNPIRLAGRLEKFFGGKQGFLENPCDCSCKGSTSIFSSSCCCLACESNMCFASCSPGCLCPQSGPCPRKVFCEAIQNVKVLVGSNDMTCCSKGQKCHCSLTGSGSNCQSGQCCVVPSGRNSYHSLKCLIRRLVKFFKDLSLDSSNKNCSKICCEIFCVLKTCEFLRDFYNESTSWAGKECSKCKGGTQTKCTQGTGKGSKCCGKNISQCTAPDCCQGCPDCNAIKLGKALQELQYSGPCGQDLWRTLDSFLYYCCNVFEPYVNKKEVKEKINAAKGKCQQCSKKTSGTPCSCSNTSGCLGCKDLRGHNDIMSILRQGYLSSYDSSAKWESLCSYKSASCSCFPLTPCPAGGCCEKCPKRLCAKIFLGMLPCLYFGLKILYERCQYGSDFPDWSLRKITEGSIGKFLKAWGFDLNPLSSKNASGLPPILENLYGSGKFKSLLDFVSKKYFSRYLSDPSKPSPKTVRQMLLWLYGLRFQKHFSDLVENCKSFCLPFGNSFHPDAFCYYIYTCSFILPLAIISFIETSESAQKVFTSAEWKTFSYPSDPSELFETFCDFVRKIYTALTFLKFQCERVGSQAGWKYCYFGKECKVEPLDSTQVSPSSPSDCSCQYKNIYLCSTKSGNPIHDHCLKGSCRGFGSSGSCDNSKVHTKAKSQTCSNPCPHPLMRFLTATSNSDSESYPFDLSGIVPMGFSQEKLPEKAVQGLSLHAVLTVFCEDGFYPLTRLVQFILCVSQRPPESLFDLYAFFKKFVEALNSKPDLSSTFVQWIDGEPGRYPGKIFVATIQNLYGSGDSHWEDPKLNGKPTGTHKNSDEYPANLFSLSSCHAKKESGATCGPYLHPLTDKASGVFNKELCSMYLSWICYRAEKFYSEFQKLHKEAQETFSSSCSHCRSCQNIVRCPCALPFIYSYGFTFMSPGGLACEDGDGRSRHGRGGGKHDEGDSKCTTKSCSDFLTQLKLVAEGHLFRDLLKVIDNFLWHIRLPFIYAFLYIWILVISYFYYVQFYKLDLLHIDSHLHLPRSFKIPPSILFSDASSKLKDLSYFTL